MNSRLEQLIYSIIAAVLAYLGLAQTGALATYGDFGIGGFQIPPELAAAIGAAIFSMLDKRLPLWLKGIVGPLIQPIINKILGINPVSANAPDADDVVGQQAGAVSFGKLVCEKAPGRYLEYRATVAEVGGKVWADALPEPPKSDTKVSA